MEVYVNGHQVRIDPTKSLGRGGEAEVFDIGRGVAVKIFKPPSHEDYKDEPVEQEGARKRILEHQTKLFEFPKNLPKQVIAPIDLATTRARKKILGYTMPIIRDSEVLLKYATRDFRDKGISNAEVIEIFRNLHTIVFGIHNVGVVIGDFNDLNILIVNGQAFVIDADSMQFGKFLCKVFTEKFVDPLLCDPNKTSPFLYKLYNAESDWYAYTVMLMQCLLFVGPYGGIYAPKDKTKRVKQGQRALKRITVFDDEVRYPKPATHYSVLPDALLQEFFKIFKKDARGEFPIALLETMRWTRCTACGIEHARNLCPACSQVTPAMVKEVTVVRGKVTATRIFQTKGMVLFADFQNGDLKWLYHEDEKFKREDGSVVTSGAINRKMRFRIQRENTLIGIDRTLATLSPGKSPTKLAVDHFYQLPMFDANSNSRFWIESGRLMRDGKFAPEYIGDVLQDQTLFWVGKEFGFGFYRAGEINVFFVFDTTQGRINDSLTLPRISGQLIDATCVFGKNRGWFFVSVRKSGKTINRCIVIKKDGTLEAVAEAEEGSDSWLSSIRGKCAAGNFLLAATDEGIVRVEANGGSIIKTKEFPDTEPFVDSGCHLFTGKGGLYVVSRSKVMFLKID